MLKVRETFGFQHYDDGGRSIDDKYLAGSYWLTTGFNEDWREITECVVRDGKTVITNRSRWIPETMLDKFELVEE